MKECGAREKAARPGIRSVLTDLRNSAASSVTLNLPSWSAMNGMACPSAGMVSNCLQPSRVALWPASTHSRQIESAFLQIRSLRSITLMRAGKTANSLRKSRKPCVSLNCNPLFGAYPFLIPTLASEDRLCSQNPFSWAVLY